MKTGLVKHLLMVVAVMVALSVVGSVACAAGWTTTSAKISTVQIIRNGSWYMRLDPAVTVENVNSCNLHNNWFQITSTNTNTNDSRAILSMVALARSLDSEVRVYSTGCAPSSNNYNQLDGIQPLP